MLSKEENELLCRTGPGTPMGELFPAGVIALRHRLLKGGARSAGRTGAIGDPLRRRVSRAPKRQSEAP